MAKAKFVVYGNIKGFGNSTWGMKEALRFRLKSIVRDATSVTVTKIDIIKEDKNDLQL